jgi:hypothetical protein
MQDCHVKPGQAMNVRPNKRGARVGPRTPAVKWLSAPIPLTVRNRGRIVGVTDDTANAEALFRELEREGQHDEGRTV